jgi:hypothetical protein
MKRPKWEFFTGDRNWLEHGGTWIKRHEDYFEFVELWPYDGNEKYIVFYEGEKVTICYTLKKSEVVIKREELNDDEY